MSLMKEYGEKETAEARYQELLENNDEVEAIAENTGFSVDQILLIKSNLFRLTEPCIEIADAWERLASGEHTIADVYILKGVLWDSYQMLNKDAIDTIEKAAAELSDKGNSSHNYY